jgi:RNA polymerase sigma-70 factor, ECF subfamily
MNQKFSEKKFIESPKTREMQQEFLINIMDEFGDHVVRLSYIYTKNKQVAEDISQEVFIKIYNSFYDFNWNSSIKTWITRITINCCKDYLKSSWFRRVGIINSNYFSLLRSKEKDLEIQFINQEENDRLMKMILSLPIKYREVIMLYYYQDVSTLELSKLLSVPTETIRTRIRRGRIILKNMLEKGEINFGEET